MKCCSNNIFRTKCFNKSCRDKPQKKFLFLAIVVGTVVSTLIVVTAVPTRVVEPAAKEIFVPTSIIGTIVHTMIVGTAVPIIIVLTAYYWKSCGQAN